MTGQHSCVWWTASKPAVQCCGVCLSKTLFMNNVLWSVLYSMSPVLYCLQKTPRGRKVAKSMMKLCAFENQIICEYLHLTLLMNMIEWTK